MRTLTRNLGLEYPFGGRMRAAQLDFSDPDEFRCFMEGAGVLYNTYWVRFGRGRATFDQAVQNARILFEAAAREDVGRMVRFFRGKGLVEEILKDTGIPYAIIRPTLVFGEGDLLLNNMAWALRRFPVFPVFGSGDYSVQLIYAEDLAALAVAVGCRRENLNVDAAGPDTFTFEELLRLLALAVGARVRLVHTPQPLGSP